MKKVPSFSKVTSNTNITVTQTQNISINSPKGMGLNTIVGAKKLFKSNKNIKQQLDSFDGEEVTQKHNATHGSFKGEKVIASCREKDNVPHSHLQARRQSVGVKVSRERSDHSKKIERKRVSKQEIRKLDQKLKELERKIELLKSKKKERISRRSYSRNQDIAAKKELMATHKEPMATHKEPMATHKEAKKSVKVKRERVTVLGTEMIEETQIDISTNKKGKVLKKSHSDKNYLKLRLKNKRQDENNTLKSEQDDTEIIHKFVTQVTRSKIEEQLSKREQAKILKKITYYYIENMVDSLTEVYLMNFQDHLAQSMQTLRFLQHTRKPTLKQLEKHSVLLPASTMKHTVVLDLDETLIHCNQSLQMPHDVTLQIKFPGGEKIDAGINIRPFAKELLKELSTFCEVIVFTASHECYANVVLNHLDPKREWISHRLFRNNCWHTEEEIYVKDLRVIKNRRLENILLVDNAAYSYHFQLQNGIPIVPYYDNSYDEELLHLLAYLKKIIVQKEDTPQRSIQELNAKYFQLCHYNKFDSLESLINKLYRPVLNMQKLLIF